MKYDRNLFNIQTIMLQFGISDTVKQPVVQNDF